MLAHRVIPALLMRGDKLVKGQRFNSWRSVGVVEQAVRVHQQRGVDEIILLDIAATPEGRGPDFAAIERLSDCCFSPLTVGGGVRGAEDVDALLRAGADKVSVCTAAHQNPVIWQAALRIGCQAIVASVDVGRSGTVRANCGKFETGIDAPRYARRMEQLGAGEILLTSIDREGTMQGYDLDLIRAVSEAVSIPVIAHGGCSGPEDMLAAIRAGASACAAGALFQFTDTTPRDCAEYLKAKNVEARV